MTQENGISCPEVCAVEASDSSCKRGGLILSAEHMRSGQHDISSVLLRSTQLLTLWQQLESSAATQCVQIAYRYPSLKKKKTATAWHSKTLITQGLSVQVISQLHHPEHRVGWTLTFDHTESVDVFSLCKPAFVLTNQQQNRADSAHSSSFPVSFSFSFLPTSQV